ncbi:hypothetical protein HYH03_001836 [Edaphochlamys debaryana]|uniref:Ankyrin repeat domain-containing protein n=1 Tax=Edaphochlamys debaryana TaxID=47281 RepID=A0A835YFH1_9CHLO|nr:hypothetical protein HYH03_001836 [Edaphochlamys debaryana]|eukprot:KAG2500258.1 hypothetical protein HYH03_001836 [Edaphochlamys debaryana]
MSLRERRQLLRQVAASGSTENLKVAVAASGCLLAASVFEGAAAGGHVSTTCAWLRAQGCPTESLAGSSALVAAAAAKQRATVDWLLRQGCAWCERAVGAAGAAGAVDLMRHLAQQRPHQEEEEAQEEAEEEWEMEVDERFATLAHGADLVTLQRLLAEWPEWLVGSSSEQRRRSLGEQERAALLAAAAGSPTADWAAKVAWLETQRGAPKTSAAARKAARCPDAATRLRWLQSRGCPFDSGAAAAAARAGSTEALSLLLAQGVAPGPEVSRAAAAGGSVECLRLLHTARCPFDGEACLLEAAEGGHRGAVLWLLEEGIVGRPPAAGALAAALEAAARGAAGQAAVGVLGALWERAAGGGVALGEGVWLKAAAAGCSEVLEWLGARGCAKGDSGEAYVTAARHGDLATLATLKRLGCPWGAPPGRTFTRCVHQVGCEGARLPVLQWLAEAGCPVECAEALRAAGGRREGRAEVTAWLQKRGG